MKISYRKLTGFGPTNRITSAASSSATGCLFKISAVAKISFIDKNAATVDGIPLTSLPLARTPTTYPVVGARDAIFASTIQPAAFNCAASCREKNAASISSPYNSILTLVPEKRVISSIKFFELSPFIHRGDTTFNSRLLSNFNCVASRSSIAARSFASAARSVAAAAFSLAFATSALAFAVSNSSCATFSFDHSLSKSQWCSLTIPIHTMSTVAAAPITKLPINTKLPRSNNQLAVSSEGHGSFPTWFPISAIIIILTMGIAGMIAIYRAVRRKR